jgi:hypothetical protein
MSILVSDPEVDIVTASGVVRVAIRPKLNLLSLVGVTAIIVVFATIRILTELQCASPNVAKQVCSRPDDKKHFVTLNLS